MKREHVSTERVSVAMDVCTPVVAAFRDKGAADERRDCTHVPTSSPGDDPPPPLPVKCERSNGSLEDKWNKRWSLRDRLST